MSDNIPYEIQMEIIERVPDLKSLIRFRSVSKQWKAFVDSSKFITAYGARVTNNLLLRYISVNCQVKYVSFTNDVSFPQQQLDFAPYVPDLVKQLRSSTVVGSSCGLWCLYGFHGLEKEMFIIWNPSIKKSIGIVVPGELNNTTSRKLTHFGFGVSPSTYDPTIVGISRCFQGGKYKHNYKITWQVGIFTLSSKTWKIIPSSSNMIRESIRVTPSTQLATSRFIFWVANDDDRSNCKKLILSFDLITHEFKEVNLPDCIANPFQKYFSISKLRDSLVVSTYTDEVNGRVYGAWMMGEEEGGVMTSFTKIFTIKTFGIRKVLGFTMSGEPIIEIHQSSRLTKIKVYDPCSEHINDIGITGVNGSFFICPYTESLLLTDHSDGCMIPNNYRSRN